MLAPVRALGEAKLVVAIVADISVLFWHHDVAGNSTSTALVLHLAH